MSWLPPAKRAAVCFSVDDIHPAPVAREALGHVEWLQERHPQLRVTLFATPDWRTLDPYPTSGFLARIPVVRDHVFTVAVHPRGTFRLDLHEACCAFRRISRPRRRSIAHWPSSTAEASSRSRHTSSSSRAPIALSTASRRSIANIFIAYSPP